MNRCLAKISLSAFSIAALVAGCQKPADQQSSPDANANANNAAPSMADAAKTAVQKAIEPKPLVIPADTVASDVLDQTISSKPTRAGDKVTATVEAPIEIEAGCAIPK